MSIIQFVCSSDREVTTTGRLKYREVTLSGAVQNKISTTESRRGSRLQKDKGEAPPIRTKAATYVIRGTALMRGPEVPSRLRFGPDVLVTACCCINENPLRPRW